ncbi:ribosome assembly RNA-binding protein YhbY [Chitinispirillales bacterium ANBcel5]|uniref:ribosome assembly RNA-binding protein YhbY n=1 Tax=Cellulosispirillum alkaliphilum TaxID=3039283 RepID=UPI002A53B5EF|nr:ribosome assembly RNA-binding protein YhbY [Chitinispirillales bacterium ANBcel5]
MSQLSTKQRQYLKGLAHSLNPVIQIGKDGLSEGIISQISESLDDHELIKINLLESSGLDRNEAAEEICRKTGAQKVQVLGFKIILFRRNKEKAQITLP